MSLASQIVAGFTRVGQEIKSVRAAAADASNLASGTVPVARLGSTGTPDGTTFLRGDNTWATPPGGSVMIGTLAPTDPPSSYPAGPSLFQTSDAGWPEQYGTVSTQYVSVNRAWQTYFSKSGTTWTRSADTGKAGGWTAWLEIVSTSSGDVRYVSTIERNATGPSLGQSAMVRDFGFYSEGGSGLTGDIVIQSNIAFNNYMCRLQITGYSYEAAAQDIDLTVTFYTYNPGTPQFYNYSVINKGQVQFSSVRLARRTSDNKPIIILTPATGSWSYPKIRVEGIIGHSTPPDSELQEWAITRTTSLAAYTLMTTPTIRTTVLDNDLRLSDARTPTAHTHGVADLGSSTSTKNGTTILRGDGYWAPGPDTTSISDWNDAITNGKYMGYGAANAPTSGIWYIGEVTRHNDSWVCQEVWAFAGSDPDLIARYRRFSFNGSWSAWRRIYDQQANLDALYAAKSHGHSLTDANITGTLPIAQIPVAGSGSSSSTQVVRADDSRLSNARTPTYHTHRTNDIQRFTADIAINGNADYTLTTTAANIASWSTGLSFAGQILFVTVMLDVEAGTASNASLVGNLNVTGGGHGGGLLLFKSTSSVNRSTISGSWIVTTTSSSVSVTLSVSKNTANGNILIRGSNSKMGIVEL